VFECERVWGVQVSSHSLRYKKYLSSSHGLHETNFSFSSSPSPPPLSSQLGHPSTHINSYQIPPSITPPPTLPFTSPFQIPFSSNLHKGSNPVLQWIPYHRSHLPSFSLPDNLSSSGGVESPPLLATSAALCLVFALCLVLDPEICEKFPVE